MLYLNDEEFDLDAQEVDFCAATTLAEAMRFGHSAVTPTANLQPLYQTIRLTVEAAGSAAIALDKQNGRRISAQLAEHHALAAIVRDIFGNPFRPIKITFSWLTSTVLALANGIYAEKGFDRMPILADALQEADCDNEDILNHCREQREHVKGCWLVDLVLIRK